MGKVAQKRLVRRIDLERFLQRIPPHPSPKASLEQYTIPVDVAAETLFLAAYVHDDIVGKTIADLGCGTGRLVLGAVFLGAADAVGVDIDKAAIKTAKENSDRLNMKEKTSWILGDIDALCGSFHTVVQNPPFGVQRRGADRRFVSKALELSRIVYSLHKSGASNRAFIKKFIERHRGKVTSIFQMKLDIQRQFRFHAERKHTVKVDLYRMEAAGE